MHLDEMLALIKSFLWKGKKAKIAYDKLTQDYEKGRLKLVDLFEKNKAIKLAWIERIIKMGELQEEEPPFWYLTANKALPVPVEQFLQCNISKKDLKSFDIKNKFWESVFLA